MLAPRFQWIPAWFSFTSEPRTYPRVEETDSSDEDDMDQLAQALDRLIERPPLSCRRPPIVKEDMSSSEYTASENDVATQEDPIR